MLEVQLHAGGQVLYQLSHSPGSIHSFVRSLSFLRQQGFQTHSVAEDDSERLVLRLLPPESSQTCAILLSSKFHISIAALLHRSTDVDLSEQVPVVSPHSRVSILRSSL